MATYLQVVELHGTAELPPATRALYDVHANTASFSIGPEFMEDGGHLNFELTTEGYHFSFELVEAPAPGALSARNVPPWRRTMSWLIDRPRPVPPRLSLVE